MVETAWATRTRSAEQIPIAARILRVADAYAALTDARPFAPHSRKRQRACISRSGRGWSSIRTSPRLLSLANLPALRSYATRHEATMAATPDVDTERDDGRAFVKSRLKDRTSAVTFSVGNELTCNARSQHTGRRFDKHSKLASDQDSPV